MIDIKILKLALDRMLRHEAVRVFDNAGHPLDGHELAQLLYPHIEQAEYTERSRAVGVEAERPRKYGVVSRERVHQSFIDPWLRDRWILLVDTEAMAQALNEAIRNKETEEKE